MAAKEITLTALRNAKKWLELAVKIVTGKAVPKKNRPRLVPAAGVSAKTIGRMIMFRYDPKTKDKLPYYDTFPVVMVIRPISDGKSSGFLGLNLHYLPINLRKELLANIIVHHKSKHLNENKRLQLSYEFLKGTERMSAFKPCLKRYIYSHCASIYQVDPDEWMNVAALPFERFKKASKEEVWRDSRRMID